MSFRALLVICLLVGSSLQRYDGSLDPELRMSYDRLEAFLKDHDDQRIQQMMKENKVLPQQVDCSAHRFEGFVQNVQYSVPRT